MPFAKGRYPLGRASLVFAFAALTPYATAGYPPQSGTDSSDSQALRNLSLEQLSQIEVTSPSKEPTPAFKSPVAIYVITGEDIRRSGATTIPEALRLAPG